MQLLPWNWWYRSPSWWSGRRTGIGLIFKCYEFFSVISLDTWFASVEVLNVWYNWQEIEWARLPRRPGWCHWSASDRKKCTVRTCLAAVLVTPVRLESDIFVSNRCHIVLSLIVCFQHRERSNRREPAHPHLYWWAVRFEDAMKILQTSKKASHTLPRWILQCRT